MILAVDEECQADEEWYRSNRTQPRRDQPWYKVLVHGANHTTYVAEENLEPDPSGLKKVKNSLVDPGVMRFMEKVQQRSKDLN